ncbi:hypothetical protein ACIRSU_02905 [Streptomyces sp. NPDC101160]|uniref:hypothetical protein n=1 Tax=Streptomyces sp. NPDC101160 TaxID=3366118 RepID=UPI00380954C5
MRLRKAVTALAMTAAAAVGTGLMSAPAAQAATPSPNCLGARAFCFFYNSSQQGSVIGWDMNTGWRGTENLYNYGSFITPGAGQGVPVYDHAASATYQYPGVCYGFVRVYREAGWTGSVFEDVPACSSINLTTGLTKNHNRAIQRIG